jgi:hypothetical protein
MPERRYHILVTLKNTTTGTKTFSPVIRYAGIDPLKKTGNDIQLDEYSKLSSSAELQEPKEDSSMHYTVPLKPVTLKAAEQQQVVVTISRFFSSKMPFHPATTGC